MEISEESQVQLELKLNITCIQLSACAHEGTKYVSQSPGGVGGEGEMHRNAVGE